MLTVQSLVEDLGLELTAGQEAAGTPVRWVHISELNDPTPWLSGGELLLTTGIQLRDETSQREFVRLLSEHHLAGLGFGTGFDHEQLPAALVAEAGERGFPLFEVPYRMPFIALTEKAFTQLVNEQYEVLQRGIATQKRLERLVLDERGLSEIVRALAATLGGAVLVLDAHGEVVTQAAFRRDFPADALASVQREVVEHSDAASAFAPEHPEVSGRAHALPVAVNGRGGPSAWLVAARDAGGLGDFERLILQQAVTVVALELMRQRTMRDTERRLAGDLLAEAVSGSLEPRELAARLRPFGIGDDTAVLVFAVENPHAAEGDLDKALSAEGVNALVASREHLLCALADCSQHDAVELTGRLRAQLRERHGEVRAAASRPAPAAAVRRSFHEARCALEAVALANGSAPDVASYRDLGAFNLLLSLQDDEALRLFCDSVLGPLEEGEGEYGEELLRSLEAFIEQNGQWEKAARQLYCHRHTLRYRIRRIEQLTGRDLSLARDRIEFWLALRARELVT